MCVTNLILRNFYVFRCISLKDYIELLTFSYTKLSPPPPVIHNFRYKASVEHGNE